MADRVAADTPFALAVIRLRALLGSLEPKLRRCHDR
jgi:hypothetical protein